MTITVYGGPVLAALLAAAISWVGRFALPQMQALFVALLKECPADGSSGIHLIAQAERLVCAATALVNAIPRPALTYFFTSVAAPLVLFPILESTRPGVPAHLSRPVVALLFSHVLLLPLSIPLYALLFLMRSRSSPPAPLAQAHAESAVFGFLIGPAVLSGAMLGLEDPGVTAVWQFACLVSAGAHYAHLLARRATESGYELVRGALLVVFMLSSSSHIALAAEALGDPGKVAKMVLPTFGVTLEERDALKWTGIVGVGSTVLATLSFADNLQQLLGLVGWYVFALPFAGPAAAITGTLLWRESQTQPEKAVAPTVDKLAVAEQPQGASESDALVPSTVPAIDLEPRFEF
ncbi:hypothetical protein K523DRAFT_377779 [Schizophyllum commune Tattone D]|nr:hypothetical protein K523DRAFT_377779 [Schizophyllum commune Tattone D]